MGMGSDLSFICFRYFCVAGATSKAGENRAEGTGKSLLKNKEIASLYLGCK